MKKSLIVASLLIGASGLLLGACDNSPDQRAAYQRNFDAGVTPSGDVLPTAEKPMTGAPGR